MPSTVAIVDTGFFVALFAKDDVHHRSAVDFLGGAPGTHLHTIWPVIAETCFFLDARAKSALLKWLERGTVTLHEIAIGDLPGIRKILDKYRDLAPDFTDAALVALAGSLGVSNIITVDRRDFSAYRMPDGTRFKRLWL